MKLVTKIARIILALSCLASCNYLDVIPPAQADFKDTMKDMETTLGFLYSCYVNVPRSTPFHNHAFEQSADEIAAPPQYSNWPQQVAWGTISAGYYNNDLGGENMSIWYPSYNSLGQIHQFLKLIDELHPTGVTDNDKNEYKAECYFLEAYYHFRILQAFGPCPIITEIVDPNTTKDKIPGRSHFDYCVDYIVDKLDKAAYNLPAVRPTNQLGRATSTICKALKSRVLLYAASPLWNGAFPYPEWKNKNYETPGYGYELISHSPDPHKWQRALTACEEAINAAIDAGYELFDIETANAKAIRDNLGLPFIPGKEEDTPKIENSKNGYVCSSIFQLPMKAITIKK